MSDLPNGWIAATLNDISSVVRGITFPSSAKETTPSDSNACCLRTSNVQREVDWSDIYYVSRSYVKREEQYVQTGDVLMSMANSYALVGKVAMVKNVQSLTAFGAFLSAVRPTAAVHGQYLFHLLRTERVQQELREGSSQTTNIANISVGRLASIAVPVAPRNEQTRIADKLDAVLARVDACRKRLNRIPSILKRFRQSVLAAATSGKLTAEWRESNAEHFPWRKVQLGQVAQSRLGKMLDKSKNIGIETRYLRNINVRWFAFDVSDILTMRVTPEEKARLTIEKGDVLICEGGEPGRCAVWRSPESIFVYQKALHRVRVASSCLPEWLCYTLKDAADSGQLAAHFTGTTIKHFTGESLKAWSFNLPGREEQTEIVRRVESLFAFADRLEARYTAARTQVQKLTPSLLAKAFRGELVPQDPDDKPASELLARITALSQEKARKKSPAKGRG